MCNDFKSTVTSVTQVNLITKKESLRSQFLAYKNYVTSLQVIRKNDFKSCNHYLKCTCILKISHKTKSNDMPSLLPHTLLNPWIIRSFEWQQQRQAVHLSQNTQHPHI